MPNTDTLWPTLKYLLIAIIVLVIMLWILYGLGHLIPALQPLLPPPLRGTEVLDVL